jgi:hypothetical protein
MEKLLENAGWPLAIVFILIAFFVIFRLPISNLIGRIRGFSYGNKAIDMGGSQTTVAVEKQKQLEGPVGTTASTAPDAIPASHAMPPPNEVYAPTEKTIRTALTQSQIPADAEKAWLIRTAAVFSVQRNNLPGNSRLADQSDAIGQHAKPADDREGAGNFRSGKISVSCNLYQFRI